MRKRSMEELERASVESFKDQEKAPIVVVLDNVRSMNNVGSIFRTSDAFAIETLYLCGITGTPPHRDIHKTALGAEESVQWKHYENTTDCLKDLKKEGFKIIALEQTDKSYHLLDFVPLESKKYAFVFGNEVEGVSDEALALCHEAIEIPQLGTKHSFNVSITAGIVLWDYVLKMDMLSADED